MAVITGISTMNTFLMVKEQGEYKKLVDITSTPDFGGEPTKADISTLSNESRVYTLSIQDQNTMTCECNYTPENVKRLETFKNKTNDFALWMGREDTKNSDGSPKPDGHLGKLEWTGEMTFNMKSGSVGDSHKMDISIVPNTDFVFNFDAYETWAAAQQ